ncbi:hypothetical protein JCM9533A_10450 [Catenuloplanes niger JCM 9533]
MQGLGRCSRRQQLPCLEAQRADLVAIDLLDQVLPGREVPVQGGVSHAGAFGDRVQRDGHPPAQAARLNEVSAIDLGFPHAMLAGDHIRIQTRGDLKIQERH